MRADGAAQIVRGSACSMPQIPPLRAGEQHDVKGELGFIALPEKAATLLGEDFFRTAGP